jgi:hypothetical protein
MNNLLYIERGLYINVTKICKINRYITSETKKRYYVVCLDDGQKIQVQEYDENDETTLGWERLSEYLETYKVRLPSDHNK